LVLLIFKNSVYNRCFFGGEQEKDCELEPKPAPNCGYGKSIELSYANLEVEQNHYRVKKLFDHPTQN
jgi:hypothetical protein